MSKATEIRSSKLNSVKRLSIFRTIAIALALVAAVLIRTPVQAAVATETLERIESAVLQFVEQQYPTNGDLTIRVGRLDRRLRLVRCRKALESTWAPGSATVGQATVAVRCEGARPWKLYVPVRVAILQYVAVTTRLMARGERIRASDLVLEKRTLGQQRGTAIRDPEQVQGYVLKNSVPAGKVMMVRMLSAPKLVKRGRIVVLTADSPGLNIRMKGVALEDGLMGETVKVRNTVSKRILYATVIAPDRVQTRAP